MVVEVGHGLQTQINFLTKALLLEHILAMLERLMETLVQLAIANCTTINITLVIDL